MKNTFKIQFYKGDFEAPDGEPIIVENQVGGFLEEHALERFKLFTTFTNEFLGSDSAKAPNANASDLVLMDSAYGVSVDGNVCNLFKVGPSMSTIPTTISESNSRITGYCRNLNTSTAGTKGGTWSSALSGPVTGRGSKYVWEWGLTQGNGTIAALGLFASNYGLLASPTQVPTYYNANLPSGGGLYMGYKTVSGVKRLYFRDASTSTNNILIINGTTFETIGNQSLAFGSEFYYGYSRFAGGYYTTMTGNISSTLLTLKKAAEGGSFGSAFTVPWTRPVGWSSQLMNAVFCDEDYMYFYVSDGSTKSVIIRYNPVDDSTTTTDVSSIFTGAANTTDFLTLCPFTGKLFFYNTFFGTNAIFECAGLSDIANVVPVAFTAGSGTAATLQAIFQMNGQLMINFSNNGTDTANVYFYRKLWSQPRGNFYTYAELPIPITKTGANSLRIEYTLGR